MELHNVHERPATAPTSFLKRPKTVAKGLSIFNLVRHMQPVLLLLFAQRSVLPVSMNLAPFDVFSSV